jgi:hypothetical protein
MTPAARITSSNSAARSTQSVTGPSGATGRPAVLPAAQKESVTAKETSFSSRTILTSVQVRTTRLKTVVQTLAALRNASGPPGASGQNAAQDATAAQELAIGRKEGAEIF